MDFEELFVAWQQKYTFTAFIKDGIVDAEKYEHPHILFILRDKNDNKAGDLRQGLCECGEGWRTWNNVARWTIALLDNLDEYPRAIPRSERIKQVRRIAAMNLKKECGNSRVNGNDLKSAVEGQQEYILHEIDLCNPDIIICCGLESASVTATDELLKSFVFSNVEDGPDLYIQNSCFGRQWKYCYASISGRRVPVIGFAHPQVCFLNGYNGHTLFKALYEDMRMIGMRFLNSRNTEASI